jgi:ABC-type polysaccharide/polyol phosphate export permease
MTARSEVPAQFRSSAKQPGPIGLIKVGIRETLSRRRLIAYLVRADLRKTGADTLLGNLWWVIDPLLQMLVYWVFVGLILGRGGLPDYPLFIFAAILPWKWFDSTMKGGVSAIVSRERLIKQIYFPKLVLPVAGTLSSVVNFAFGLIPLLAMMVLIYPSHLTAWLLLIPVVAAVQLLFSGSIAIAVSGMNVFYRDLGNLTRHVMRFWFFLSPTLYGIEQVAQIADTYPIANVWFQINPWTYLLGSYRNVVYYGEAPMWGGLLVIAAGSIVLGAMAILLFKRLEPAFAKVL